MKQTAIKISSADLRTQSSYRKKQPHFDFINMIFDSLRQCYSMWAMQSESTLNHLNFGFPYREGEKIIIYAKSTWVNNPVVEPKVEYKKWNRESNWPERPFYICKPQLQEYTTSHGTKKNPPINFQQNENEFYS